MFDGSLLKTVKHIHFIGIGGSGMFPIVQILHAQGYFITGSDNNESDTVSLERSMGIPVIFEEQNINSIYPESEFLITIHGAFAQSESEGISSRVKWGKHQAKRTERHCLPKMQL